MDFESLAKQRFSVRSFADRPLEKALLDKILEAGRIAPTAKNKQPQRVYVLQSEEALAKIRAITTCAFNAPVVLLICADVTEAWKNEENGINTAVMDASIVTTHMMLQATDLGIGSCWVCRFGAEKVKIAFDLPENILPCCLLPLGYIATDAIPSSRHELRKSMDEIVFYR